MVRRGEHISKSYARVKMILSDRVVVEIAPEAMESNAPTRIKRRTAEGSMSTR